MRVLVFKRLWDEIEEVYPEPHRRKKTLKKIQHAQGVQRQRAELHR